MEQFPSWHLRLGEAAIEAADVTLISGNLRAVVTSIQVSKATMRNVYQNLIWAFGYNILLIPMAMGALYPLLHVLLNPVLAAAAMAMSSVSVVTNALRLRGFRRPSNPQEILHPRLMERLREYSYLWGISVMAIAIGAVALYLTNTFGGMR